MRLYAGTRVRIPGRPLYVGLSGPVHFRQGNLPFWLGFLMFPLLAWLLLR